MLHPSVIASILAVMALGAVTAGCTQDFNQFTGGTGGAGGSNGAGGTTSSGSLTASSASSSSAANSSASSSSTASSSTASSSTSSASSSASSSSGGMVEDCTNGKDDDGNGMTDCADPACTAGYTCTPNPPAGWIGPVALYNGLPANKPMCPADHPNKAYEGNAGIIDTPAMCSACSCSTPTVNCVPGTVQLDSDLMCTTPVGSLVQPPVGMCGPIVPPPTTKSAKAPAPTGTASACVPSMVTATLPPPQWMTTALACSGGGVGAGCGATAECVPKTSAPFEMGLCVWRSGDMPCPAGYGTKFLYDDTVADSRGCTACSCGAGVPTCSATTTLYSGPNCNGSVDATIPNDGTCAFVSAGGGSTMMVTVTKSGSCPSGGGQPTGMVVAGAIHTTVCCSP